MTDFSDNKFFVEFVKSSVTDGESVTVKGDGGSMLPFINPETDRITLSPLPEKLRRGDICLYVRPDGSPVIHRICRVRRNGFDMNGDGQILIERNVPKQAVIAVVSSRIRNGESFDCLSRKAEISSMLAMRKKLLRFRLRRFRYTIIEIIRHFIKKD